MAMQPTNAGIHYQQRVSAQFLAVMLTCADLKDWISSGDGRLVSVRFESRDEIDDLVLENDAGSTCYLQIKRTVSFSTLPDSPFFKTIRQFVRQFIACPEQGKYYLAVSTNSSSQINDKLRRLLNSLRCSGQLALTIPNKSDQKTLDAFLSCIRAAYHSETGSSISDAALAQLCHRIFIEVYDIKDGLCQERLCKMLLASKHNRHYETIWHSLIVDAADFAANRYTVTYDYLCAHYKDYASAPQDKDPFTPVFEGEVPVGYDVILCKSKQLLDILAQRDPKIAAQADSAPPVPFAALPF